MLSLFWNQLIELNQLKDTWFNILGIYDLSSICIIIIFIISHFALIGLAPFCHLKPLG